MVFMVKTTLELRDEVYRKLVEEALKKYGNTKNISKMANEVIEEHLKETRSKAAKHFTPEKIKRRGDIVERTFGAWGHGHSGAEYVRKLRRESEKRLKRLGL